jgi:hypothetical protein
MVTLAEIQASLGRCAEAEKLLTEARAIVTAKFGSGHPTEATILRAYAGVLKKAKRKKEAQKMLEQALAIEGAQKESGWAASTRHRVDLAELVAEVSK